MIRNCLLCGTSFSAYKSSPQKFCTLLHAYIYRSKIAYIQTNIKLQKVPKNFLLWFVGFWEGEGCITFRDRWWCLTVSQKDYSIMKLIKKIFRFGKAKKHSNSKGNYTWNIYSKGEILAVVESIEKYIKLQHRKEQIAKFKKSKQIRELLQYV
jgi:hypothetical protein